MKAALHALGFGVVLALAGGSATAEPFNDQGFDWAQAEPAQRGLVVPRPPAPPVTEPVVGYNERNGNWVAAVGTERHPRRHPGRPVPERCFSGQEFGFNESQTVINLCD